MTFPIEPIEYKRKKVDRGLILGTTEYKSELVRTQNPLQCEDMTDNTRISCMSPHTRNIIVYIPEFYLSIGLRIRILTGVDGYCQYKTYRITDKSSCHIEAELLHTEKKFFQKHTLKRRERIEPETPIDFYQDNPFIEGSEMTAEKPAEIPERVKVGRKTFVKRTNYLFLHTENQKSTGSPFEKIRPERILDIYGDEALIAFASGPSFIDILTGRRVLKTRKMLEERRHVVEHYTISPTYKQAQTN